MKTKVLLAGDDPDCTFFLRQQLSNIDCQVLGTVSNAAAAIDQAGSARPDLIIMDVHLRGKTDGIDAAHQIGAQLAIPVILISGHTNEELLRRAAHAQPAAFLNKPIHFKDLHSALRLAVYDHHHSTVQDGSGEYRSEQFARARGMHSTPYQGQPSILESSLCEALDKFTLGVMLLDRRLEVSFANRSALRLLKRSPHLLLEEGHLRCTLKPAAERMERLLKRHECGLLTLPREQQLLHMLLMPLHTIWLRGRNASRFVLYMFDLHVQALEISSRLQKNYRFSETETQVLRTLLECPELLRAKQQLFISESTMRTHMKNLLHKSGHHKQVTLLHQILTEPAWSILDAQPRTKKRKEED